MTAFHQSRFYQDPRRNA